jgi:hypothetical protein
LLALNVELESVVVEFDHEVHLNLSRVACEISYNEFNTEAAVQLNKVDFIVDNERIIYDAAFKGKYQYLQSMLIELEVLQLGYEIKLHKTISKIIAIASQYEILMFSLRAKNVKKVVAIEEDDNRLEGIRAQSSRTDNLNKFLM